jgi:hypothetical protein
MVLATLAFVTAGAAGQARDQERTKRIIGATAILTETQSKVPFTARVDTGVESCSLHVEKIEIEDEAERPVRNLGKPIRFQVKNEKGQTAWIESKIVSVVRVRSSAQEAGEFDRRYKVSLTLQWEDVAAIFYAVTFWWTSKRTAVNSWPRRRGRLTAHSRWRAERRSARRFGSSRLADRRRSTCRCRPH